MMTAFGKFCRKLRIDRGELLKDMADKIGVSSAYLSAVEVGKRNIPKEWLSKIAGAYKLNEQQQEDMQEAYENSQQSVKINLKSMSNEDRSLAMVFARSFDSLDDDAKEEILSILRKRG